MWCEYSDGQITYRDDETSRKAKGVVAGHLHRGRDQPLPPAAAPPTPPQLPASPHPTRQTSQQPAAYVAAGRRTGMTGR